MRASGSFPEAWQSPSEEEIQYLVRRVTYVGEITQ